MTWTNQLYYGDCRTVMLNFPLNYIDLIYLDPPFNSQRQYNSIYKDETGQPLPDEVNAFADMWEYNSETERAAREMPILMQHSGMDDATVKLWELWLRALRYTQPRLLAYLVHMTERLLLMHRVLKDTGSIYLHCDPTASHYLKVVMDGLFGHGNFRNELIWKRTSAHSGARRYGPIHDVILFYSKSDRYTWNRVYQAYDREYVDGHYRYKDDDGRRYRTGDLTGAGTRDGESGRPWGGYDPTAAGRHWGIPRTFPGSESMPAGVIDGLEHLDAEGRIYWPKRTGGVPRFKRYLDEMQGVAAQDVLTDISPIGSQAIERMGYATQKPLALMERLIEASSNPGDVVLDPFCGCATTIEAAHKLRRRWIGIDRAYHAVNRVVRLRLGERCGLIEDRDFTIDGVPETLEAAEAKWRHNKFEFQEWAIESVDAFPTARRTGDGGIDGRLYFHVPGEDRLQSMTVEVKGGVNVKIGDVRALRGVLERDDAQMAGLILMRPRSAGQTRNFQKEMADAGTLRVLGIDYPRMQILTVDEILAGQRFETPTVAGRHLPQAVLPGLPNA